MNELALFAGAGGGILGGMLLGWRTVCAVELNAYCRRVLLARQRDGVLPRFPIWDDVRTFDGKPWRGRVDVVSGGFPCQGISHAGKKLGLSDERSGLWNEQARIISEVQPRFAFVENSPNLTFLGLDRVTADLSEMGYDCRWGTLGGAAAGMDTNGERLWIVAASADERRARILQGVEGFNGEAPGESRAAGNVNSPTLLDRIRKHESRCGEPAVLGELDGLAYRVDRLGAIGNGQIPSVAKLAWETLTLCNTP